MGVSKTRGKNPKCMFYYNASKPYEQMDDLGGIVKTLILGLKHPYQHDPPTWIETYQSNLIDSLPLSTRC